jgi:hypothetical protein
VLYPAVEVEKRVYCVTNLSGEGRRGDGVEEKHAKPDWGINVSEVRRASSISHAATRSSTHKKLESNHAVHHFPARESKGPVWKGWVGRMKSSLEGWNWSRVEGGKGMKCSLLTRILFSPASVWAFLQYSTCFYNYRATMFVWTRAERI